MGNLQELERVKAELEVLYSDHDRLTASQDTLQGCQQTSEAVCSSGPSSVTGDHQVHTWLSVVSAGLQWAILCRLLLPGMG